MRSALSVLTVAVASLAFPASSQAQTPTLTGLSCEFMAALSSFNPDAADCRGAYAGNDMHYISFIENLMETEWGFTNAEYLGSTEADGSTTEGPFGDVPTGGTGTIQLDTPLNGDYVLVLKSGNAGGEGGFSIYLFEDLVNQSSIYYTAIGTSANCRERQGVTTCTPRGLSHVSLYGGRSVSVPEPESAALLLTGLVGLGFVATRRRRDNVA